MMREESRQATLALHGGPKVRAHPWPERGLIGPEEKAAVDALFDQAIATGRAFGYNGPEEEAYCQEFADYLGGGFADAVNSGSAAVYVALKALNLPAFSEVIVSAVTDPGGMMPIPLLNCIPIVADSRPGSLQHRAGAGRGAHHPADPRHRRQPHRRRAGRHRGHRRGRAEARHPRGGGLRAVARRRVAWPASGDVRRRRRLLHHVRQAPLHRRPGRPGVHPARGRCTGPCAARADRGKPFGLPAGATNQVAALNLNLNELAAAIGRAQLKKLPRIVERRRAVVAGIEAGIRGLRTVSIPAPIPGAQPSYWFLRVRFHPEAARCDKEAFCQALAAEGLGVAAHYRAALPHTMDWFVHRRVFGDSQYPWSSPDYDGDPDRQFPCPNADAAMDAHFNLYPHEGWGDPEVEDAVRILRKVEAAFRA